MKIKLSRGCGECIRAENSPSGTVFCEVTDTERSCVRFMARMALTEIDDREYSLVESTLSCPGKGTGEICNLSAVPAKIEAFNTKS